MSHLTTCFPHLPYPTWHKWSALQAAGRQKTHTAMVRVTSKFSARTAKKVSHDATPTLSDLGLTRSQSSPVAATRRRHLDESQRAMVAGRIRTSRKRAPQMWHPPASSERAISVESYLAERDLRFEANLANRRHELGLGQPGCPVHVVEQQCG